ncbi:MAG: 2-amino-4-hydroxy-6-hydroxymethyldihydropteridine diphosphokinase [Archangiaceae bacterium]|nr:2-amino-4-hydroxy-6-hydroxymethyldihydropteridine diphosphokinase [Archangiaceae bacterium]
MTERVFVALGSNLGDRKAEIDEAVGRIGALPMTSIVGVAPIIETEALLPPENPAPQPSYFNTVAELRTTLEPEPLLTALKEIERAMGRVTTTRWAPRLIDLDLILYGARTHSSERLTLPHPGLPHRRFVLEPLTALAPELPLPGGSTPRELLRLLP